MTPTGCNDCGCGLKLGQGYESVVIAPHVTTVTTLCGKCWTKREMARLKAAIDAMRQFRDGKGERLHNRRTNGTG